MFFDKDVTINLLKQQKIDLNTITLEVFDDLINRIRIGNINSDDERQMYVNRIINDLEEITKFQENKFYEIKENPFKTEIKSGLINLLLISNEFPFFVEKHFSIKKKENLDDIINKNQSVNNYLYDYSVYFDLIKLVENHFEKYQSTKDLNLEETYK